MSFLPPPGQVFCGIDRQKDSPLKVQYILPLLYRRAAIPHVLLSFNILPVQVTPFPTYPMLHVHVKLPSLLAQVASLSHPPLFVAHSSTSASKTKKNLNLLQVDNNAIADEYYISSTGIGAKNRIIWRSLEVMVQ